MKKLLLAAIAVGCGALIGVALVSFHHIPYAVSTTSMGKASAEATSFNTKTMHKLAAVTSEMQSPTHDFTIYVPTGGLGPVKLIAWGGIPLEFEFQSTTANNTFIRISELKDNPIYMENHKWKKVITKDGYVYYRDVLVLGCNSGHGESRM